MALISNQLDGLYGGVNQQSAEHRLNSQVEEMINAYPTLDRGLLKRNPTQKLELSSSISFTQDMWTYAYDRGNSGLDEEKYSINISDGALEIVNINTGEVFKENSGLTMEGTAKDYLYPFSGKNGYAATTIKDTTFIVNKSMIPSIKTFDPDSTEAVATYNTATIDLKPSAGLYAPFTLSNNLSGYISCYVGRVKKSFPVYKEHLNSCSTEFIVDGISVVIETIHKDVLVCAGSGCNNGACTDWNVTNAGKTTYAAYSSKIFASLTAALGNDYKIEYSSTNDILITKLDETAIAITYDIVPSKGSLSVSDYINGVSYGSADNIKTETNSDYKKKGYVWLSSANSASAYTYYVDILDVNNVLDTFSATATTTTAAATALTNAINAGGDYTASNKGSIIQIVSTTELKAVEASDTWGNQASIGWTYEIASATALPKDMGFQGAIVKVTGTGDSLFATYWLEYDGSVWKETRDTSVNVSLDTSTMPHILIRNSDSSFTIKEYDGWEDMNVGDEVSNPVPSFVSSSDNLAPTIKDIFFFKNRLGFITSRNVVMSEVGEYGNFFRTTTAAVLDSDHIDTTVDTSKVISLEYATYLEDSMLLLSDKAQFRLQGGRVLSPKDVQISQTSAYDININVRPIFMNNKVFFCSTRGDNTAVMQYEVNSTTATSEAIDISAHVQTYIPNTVTSLSGDSINNLLMLTTSDDDSTIWVYKYYDNGSERVQSAWFKWTYNGIVYNAFSLGKNINIMINRVKAVAATDWVVGTGYWDNSKLWDNSQAWVMSEASLDGQDQLETSPIFPQEHTGSFLDDFTTADNETIIPTVVRIGEWIATGRGGKDIRGHLKFKTAQISSEEDSEFNLIVEDIARGTTRTIKSKYTVDRKPMIYGDAKNIRISISNSDVAGFRINTISYEGSLTKRESRR